MAEHFKGWYEKKLSEASIDTRVDLARIASYQQFVDAKSKDDLYVENILNVFIALVQYPITFIIFDKEYNLKFHLCSDKEHKSNFEKEYIESIKWNTKNSFLLFPNILNSEYRIAIFYVSTKRYVNDSRFRIIKKINKTENPSDKFEYISICATKFFHKPWYGFYTVFSDQASEAIKLSIDKISASQRELDSDKIDIDHKWPPQEDYIFQERDNILKARSFYSQEDWRARMNTIFYNSFVYRDYALHAISNLTHENPSDSDNLEKLPINTDKNEGIYPDEQPTNMFVAYRSFTRDYGRHLNSNGSYPYDVQFLTFFNEDNIDRNESEGSYFKYFNFLHRRFSSNWMESYPSQLDGRFLYQELLDNIDELEGELSGRWLDKIELFRKVSKIVDEEFWKKIKEGNEGIKYLIKILSSPVGDNARSMADPVFHTGLIHINPIYELAGLDRIDDEYLYDVDSFDMIHESIKNDLMRIVSLYYLLSGSVSLAARMRGADDPRRMIAILIPVKMRGSVWAVTIHAFYLPKYAENYRYNLTWMAGFLLATTGQQKTHELLDRALWDHVQQRIMRLMIREIGKAENRDGFVNAIYNRLNDALRAEHLLFPYALPKFRLEDGDGTECDGRDGVGYVEHSAGYNEDREEIFIRLAWTIEENLFFQARQPWSRKGTRNIIQAVDLGLQRGVAQMKAQQLTKKDVDPNA